MTKRAVKRVRKHMALTIISTRRALGLTQAALAERTGVSPKFVGEVERQEKSISADTLWRLVLALRRSGARIGPSDLFPTFAPHDEVPK